MFRQLALEEVANDCRGLGSLDFGREMAGFERRSAGRAWTPVHRLAGRTDHSSANVGRSAGGRHLVDSLTERRATVAQSEKMCGLAIINQKIANTAAKAGNPKANHHRNNRR